MRVPGGREPRYSVDIRVDCATRDLFVANRMMNISRGGFFIEATLPLHSEVDLIFRVPDAGAPIAARGRVVWNCGMRRGTTHLVAGSGIKFIAMSERHRDLLESCIRNLAEHAPPGDTEPSVWETLTSTAS